MELVVKTSVQVFVSESSALQDVTWLSKERFSPELTVVVVHSLKLGEVLVKNALSKDHLTTTTCVLVVLVLRKKELIWTNVRSTVCARMENVLTWKDPLNVNATQALIWTEVVQCVLMWTSVKYLEARFVDLESVSIHWDRSNVTVSQAIVMI